MSKNVCHYVSEDSLQDSIYRQSGHVLPQQLLQAHLRELGVELHTQDITPPQAADLILMENCPLRQPAQVIRSLKALGKPMLMSASESVAVLPANNDATLMAHFNRVFTYQDRLLGNPLYRKFNYTFNLPRPAKGNLGSGDFQVKKLLCGISANKRSSEPGQLYTARVGLYRWFEKHAPQDFDLYGFGWDRPHKVAAPLYRRKLLHKWPLRYIFAPPFTSWKGTVGSKAEVLGRYRFTICFENARNIDGYITEKIFDAMLCGSVPVYWGAPNVADHIPPECFIDYRTLGSPQALYAYLQTVSEAEHTARLDAIAAFFRSSRSDPFRHPFYVNSVGAEICAQLGIPFRPFTEPSLSPV